MCYCEKISIKTYRLNLYFGIFQNCHFLCIRCARDFYIFNIFKYTRKFFIRKDCETLFLALTLL